jgi:hypothetical protein
MLRARRAAPAAATQLPEIDARAYYTNELEMVFVLSVWALDAELEDCMTLRRRIVKLEELDGWRKVERDGD